MMVAKTRVIDNEAWEDTQAICAYCQVIPIAPGEEYCGTCAEEICTYLYSHNVN